MQVIVSGKNFKVTAPLREHAMDKASAIQKYFDHIIETDILLSVDKKRDDGSNCRVDVTVWANGTVLKSASNEADMIAAINGGIDKIERQLKKYKSKLRENTKRVGRKRAPARSAEEPEEEALEESTHTVLSLKNGGGKVKIIRTQKFAMKPMSVDEAAMQLDVLAQDFVVFRNPETNEVNVVYRRSDGNIGLIEPSLD